MGKINDLMEVPLMKHQIYGAKYALTHRWSVNGYQMGMGKTAIAIGISTLLACKTVVVCPAFLKLNWEREYLKFPKQKPKIKVIFSKDLKYFVPSDEDVIIINYELVHKAENIMLWADFIAFDESHYLGNPSAQRTKASFQYVMDSLPKYLLLLSGSPIRGRVSQWYVPIKLTGNNPAKTSGSKLTATYTKFRDAFSHSRMVDIGPRQIKKYFGLKNEKILLKLLKNKFLRKCPDYEVELPPIVFEDVYTDYEIDETDLQELMENYLEGVPLSAQLSSAKKNNAILKVPYTFSFTKNIIDSGEGPVAIYSDHRMPIFELEKLFKAKKISCTVVTGDTPVELRQRYVDMFQAGQTDVWLSTIGAGSTGITITKARIFIFNDKSWINTENDQAYKRIHRISQERDCIIYSVKSGKVDDMIDKINAEKDAVMRRAVDFGD